MDTKYQRQKEQNNAVSSLNLAIEALNLAKEIANATPAKAVFGSVGVLLTMIRDSMANERDYVELGLSCADICKALDRGMNGRRLDEFNQSVSDAINQLTTTIAKIQRKVIKRSRRNPVSRLLHAKNDGDEIIAWRSDLNRILRVFNTELAINTHTIVSDVHHGVADTHTMVSDLHRNMLKGREGTDDQHRPTQASIPGESPPPPPRIFYGRNELIEKIVGLVENLTPIALIGAGGIGKTSIALTVLHDNRVKERFGDSRWFIRCDKFPASLTHFLRRLSKAIGAGVENPEDLTPLRPFLSSGEIFVVLDNAESILDPRGTNAREIYGVVEELSQFSNVCLCLTSRISTIPTACESLDIPTLSMEAARDTFYRIYKHGEQRDLINNILEQLDFHPLSVTLLATVAHHNKWGTDRLASEWERRRTNVLQTQHDKSLAATIELSLSSPMFQELGPDARDLLGVVAFFPRGVDEKNIDWLFPTLSDGTNIFDNFCVLSLTYRSNGFVTMLAPLRDYLCPQDLMSSQLLCTTKDRYFSRLSVRVDPDKPNFKETRWVMSEDVNIEHLLDAFTTVDTNSGGVWDACADFMEHLYWHKQRLVMLGPKIEGLPDDHPSKPRCLFELSQSLESAGNFPRAKQFLIFALGLWRERGDKLQVAQTLRFLSDTNRLLGLRKEGIEQAKEALEIYEQLNDVSGQVQSWQYLARLLHADGQPDAAEEAASRVTDLSSDKSDQFVASKRHRLLGDVCYSKGETRKAVSHFETALGIATHFNWHDEQFWCHYSLAKLFLNERRFDDAHVHIERSKLHVVNDPYSLGRAVRLEARIWYRQRRLDEAESNFLYAAEVFEKLGATQDMERCRKLLRKVKAEMNGSVATQESDSDGWGSGP